MDEEEVRWNEYRHSRDPALRAKLREKFVLQYAPLVKFVAGKVAVGMPHNIEYDDLVGFGTFGLLDAIEKYNPDKNVKFKTYAVTRIRGAIFDELRSIDWVPRSVRSKSRELENTIAELEARLGRNATDAEIAGSLGLSEEAYYKMIRGVSGASMLSLNDVWYTGDSNDRNSIGDGIEAPASLNPEVQVEREEMRSIINQAIRDLPEKEQKVLVLYYYEDLTLKEIGKVLEVTESRISQLHTRAMMHLRIKLTNVRKGIM
jgi:RNA polymerase sigma factor for flagellar operon FliA